MKIRETVKQICEKFDQFGKDLQFEVGRFTGVYRVRPVPRPLRTENVDWEQVNLQGRNSTFAREWGYALKNVKATNFTYANKNDNMSHDVALGNELGVCWGASKYNYYEHVVATRYVCMDYAVADVVLRHQRKKYGSTVPHSVARAKAFSDRKQFELLVPSRRWALRFNHQAINSRIRWRDVYREYVLTYVPTDFFYDKLGALQEEAFRASNGKAERTFYVSSSNHAMTLTFKVKKLGVINGEQQYRYSINFYDPNKTYNHKKIHSSNLSYFRNKPISGWLVHPIRARVYNDSHIHPEYPIQSGEWQFAEVPPSVIESEY